MLIKKNFDKKLIFLESNTFGDTKLCSFSSAGNHISMHCCQASAIFFTFGCLRLGTIKTVYRLPSQRQTKRKLIKFDDIF